MHIPDRLRQTVHLSEQTHADILDVSEVTYVALAERFRHSIDVVHRVGLCVPASRLMVANLCHRGYSAAQVPVPRRLYHFYAQIPSEETGEGVVVDPTWQQFLAVQLITPEMPKVLMGTSDEVVAMARSYGVGASKLDAYRPRVSGS